MSKVCSSVQLPLASGAQTGSLVPVSKTNTRTKDISVSQAYCSKLWTSSDLHPQRRRRVRGKYGSVDVRGDNARIDALGYRFAALDTDENDENDPTVEDIAERDLPPQSGPERKCATVRMCLSYTNNLEDLWRQQKDCSLDLVAATVATSTALDLLWYSEKQLYHEYHSHFPIGRSYDDLASIVYYAESIRADEDPEKFQASPKRLEITAFDEFIYLPTARVLMQFAQLRPVIENGK
ncbi:hypothetical protein LTR85_011074 [Meristemomyces frigidus]|nr:hypothetical protein LTR85_011074 [Meristemomyces frigidus]